MKGLKFSLVVLCVIFLAFILSGCPWEKSIINQLSIDNQGIPTGWVRMACVAKTDTDSGTISWGDNLEMGKGISTLYIADNISGLSDSPNMMYIVCLPCGTSLAPVKACQDQIKADLKNAGIEDSRVLDAIIRAGNQEKPALAPSLGLPNSRQEMVQLLNLLPTGAKSFAISPKSKKSVTWGSVKMGVER